MSDHSTIPFTQAGYDKLQKEYDKLTELRPQILDRLQKAREMGDLSENGMYKAARLELGDTDRRLRKLTYLLRMGRVTKTNALDTVVFGAIVTLTTDDKKVQFQLVNKHESDPREGRLSVESPLGKQLLGKRIGEQVTITTPRASTMYTVFDISFD